MGVHLADVVIHARVFDDETVDTDKPLHEMAAQYDRHLLILVNDQGIARIEGLEEGVTHAQRRELQRKLKARGFRRAEWKHNGREKGVWLNR